MLYALMIVLVGFAVLFLTERLTQKKILGAEVSRKIPHIMSGLIAVAGPFLVSMHTIALVAAAFMAATLVVRKFNIFAHMRKVDRVSWGEVFFGLGITIAALLNSSKWVFAAAVLVLALGDAAAALVGRKYGQHHFKVFTHTKSIEGTVALMVVSFIITAWLVFIAPAGLRHLWPAVIWLPLAAGIIEGVTPWGMDNLLLPVLVVVLLDIAQRL